MANNYRNQQDRNDEWFDRTNQYNNRQRYGDTDYGGYRQSGYGGNEYRGTNEGSSKYDWRNRNEQNHNAGDYRQGSAYGTGSYGNNYGWNRNPEADRNNDFDQNENYRSSLHQGWANRNMNTGNYSSPYSSNYERGNRESWRSNNENPERNHERNWWDRTRDEVSSWFGDDDAERRRRMDRLNEGGNKGKGPREYQRSPERIREDVYERLSDNDYLDASEIQVKIEKSEVVLSGTVNSRREKRLAEDIVESVSGVKNVENRIRVNESSSGMYQNTGSSGEVLRDVNQHKL